MSSSPININQSRNRPNGLSSPSLGVSLGAAAIAAVLAIPGALYFRKKKNIRLFTAPRRQTPMNTPLRSLRSIQSTASSSKAVEATPKTSTVKILPLNKIPRTSSAEIESNNDFSPALYTIGAFGIATALVSVGAVVGVWAVKTTMGIQNTQDFTREMRRIILTRMPILSARIHRVLEDANDDNGPEDLTTWNWEDAEKRLKDAFEKEGMVAWAEVALKEIQAEERLERLKRKELEDEHEERTAL